MSKSFWLMYTGYMGSTLATTLYYVTNYNALKDELWLNLLSLATCASGTLADYVTTRRHERLVPEGFEENPLINTDEDGNIVLGRKYLTGLGLMNLACLLFPPLITWGIMKHYFALKNEYGIRRKMRRLKHEKKQ